MKNYLKFILSYLLIFVIMASSFGITIHNHICGHSGKTFSSLFENNSSCECEHHDTTLHQDVESTPSCCAADPINDNNSSDLSIHQDSCCSDIATTKYLDLDYISKTQFKLSPLVLFDGFIKDIENQFNKQKNEIFCKYKSLKQKLKNFTSFSLKIITILNNYIQKDNPDDRQTA